MKRVFYLNHLLLNYLQTWQFASIIIELDGIPPKPDFFHQKESSLEFIDSF